VTGKICESDVEEFALAGSADVNAREGTPPSCFVSIAGRVGAGVGGDVRG